MAAPRYLLPSRAMEGTWGLGQPSRGFAYWLEAHLRAPAQHHFGDADGREMLEYRAVVIDPVGFEWTFDAYRKRGVVARSSEVTCSPHEFIQFRFPGMKVDAVGATRRERGH